MHLHYFLKTATAVLLTIGLTGSLALAQTPNVVINGQTMSFDQPPIEQAGRVYVPLRGVFERLGATVVYQAGLINATAGNTEISLRVGSNQATVAGQTQYLDAPPIQIGGRVLVPLRFVSQALGATVNYDPNSATVYVTQAGNASQHVGNPPPPPPHPLALLRREPDEHATVGGLRPEVSASFSQSVDPNSLRIYLDGRDVTGVAYVSDRSFSFSPAYDLPAGQHTVDVHGRVSGGSPFDERWAFTSQSTATGANFINDLHPANGSQVGSAFDVTGHTQPGSRVHIDAVASTNVANFVQISQGHMAFDVQAGPDGSFHAHVDVGNTGAAVIDVRAQSTAPDGSTAVRTLRLRP